MGYAMERNIEARVLIKDGDVAKKTTLRQFPLHGTYAESTYSY
jgi:hypothetical protein